MKIILATIGLLSICFSARAGDIPQFDVEKLAQIPAKMQEQITADEISGAVTCLVTRDGIVHCEAVGLSDIAANKPTQKDDIFWIASMTKPMTGTAIMMLQEQGKLSI